MTSGIASAPSATNTDDTNDNPSNEPPRPPPPPPTTTTTDNNNKTKTAVYRSLVIDTGAIIKGAGLSHLRDSAMSYYTTSDVIGEIRDSKSRRHLDTLPFELTVREPTARGCLAVSRFARLTGDYDSLSSTDVRVLALAHDLEMEGCGDVSHLRTEPKRMVGVGRIEALSREEEGEEQRGGEGEKGSSGNEEGGGDNENGGNATEREGGGAGAGRTASSPRRSAGASPTGDAGTTGDAGCGGTTAAAARVASSWAALVDPAAASPSPSAPTTAGAAPSVEEMATKPFGSMNLGGGDGGGGGGGGGGAPAFDGHRAEPLMPSTAGGVGDAGRRVTFQERPIRDDQHAGGVTPGQFSDAEEDEEDEEDEEEGDFDASSDCSDCSISDEECDVIVLDPDEAECRKLAREAATEAAAAAAAATPNSGGEAGGGGMDEELESDFPSLAAAATVPYEGSDDEEGRDGGPGEGSGEAPSGQESGGGGKNSGGGGQPRAFYNSFRKYGDVVQSRGALVIGGGGNDDRAVTATTSYGQSGSVTNSAVDAATASPGGRGDDEAPGTNGIGRSRIAAAELAGQSDEVDDDGEGWVTVQNLDAVRAVGASSVMGRSDLSSLEVEAADEAAGAAKNVGDDGSGNRGPPLASRCACATTDFAMQNVLLQMNLRLLSIDGVAIRRVKQWVTRCAACFSVYHAGALGGGAGTALSSKQRQEALASRLFCPKCGSDCLERISASVDSKTGRIRLHLSKRKKQKNTRGTKYSLPKPGKANRFEGELLLREDQLMMGAWNQKAKRGGKEVESMFGSDIASNFGLRDLSKRDDINVAFGRRNPNATKHGRERRGKKKKSTDKACGLRRY